MMFGVRPPGVKDSWDDCDVVTKANLLAFMQTYEHDEAETRAALAGVPTK